MADIIRIIFDEEKCTTDIFINGEKKDTSGIDGKRPEEWVYPFQINGVKWKGIFNELRAVTGNDDYTIEYTGSQKSMIELINDAPDTVNIIHRSDVPEILPENSAEEPCESAEPVISEDGGYYEADDAGESSADEETENTASEEVSESEDESIISIIPAEDEAEESLIPEEEKTDEEIYSRIKASAACSEDTVMFTEEEADALRPEDTMIWDTQQEESYSSADEEPEEAEAPPRREEQYVRNYYIDKPEHRRKTVNSDIPVRREKDDKSRLFILAVTAVILIIALILIAVIAGGRKKPELPYLPEPLPATLPPVQEEEITETEPEEEEVTEVPETSEVTSEEAETTPETTVTEPEETTQAETEPEPVTAAPETEAPATEAEHQANTEQFIKINGDGILNADASLLGLTRDELQNRLGVRIPDHSEFPWWGKELRNSDVSLNGTDITFMFQYDRLVMIIYSVRQPFSHEMFDRAQNSLGQGSMEGEFKGVINISDSAYYEMTGMYTTPDGGGEYQQRYVSRNMVS